MPDALVTKPFKAHLVLDGVERRLEAGERIAAAELAQWGRKADTLVRTGRIALVTEVAAADASLEALVNTIVSRASELGGEAVAKLDQLLGREEPAIEDLLAKLQERRDELVHLAEELGVDLHSLLALEASAEGDGASVAGGDPGGDPPSSAAPSPSAGDPAGETATEPEPGADTGDESEAPKEDESTEPASDAEEAQRATEPEPGADTGDEPSASEEA